MPLSQETRTLIRSRIDMLRTERDGLNQQIAILDASRTDLVARRTVINQQIQNLQNDLGG